jgi:hypothetical protein
LDRACLNSPRLRPRLFLLAGRNDLQSGSDSGKPGQPSECVRLATQVYPNTVFDAQGGVTAWGGPPTASNLINTLGDEQNATNFRVLSDYLTSLLQSWITNYQFFLYGLYAGTS